MGGCREGVGGGRSTARSRGTTQPSVREGPLLRLWLLRGERPVSARRASPADVKACSLGRQRAVRYLWPSRAEGLQQDIEAHLLKLRATEVPVRLDGRRCDDLGRGVGPAGFTAPAYPGSLPFSGNWECRKWLDEGGWRKLRGSAPDRPNRSAALLTCRSGIAIALTSDVRSGTYRGRRVE